MSNFLTYRRLSYSYRRISILAILILFASIFTFPISQVTTPKAAAACSNTNFNDISESEWQSIRDKNARTFSDRENIGTSEFTPYKNQLDISDLGGSPFSWYSAGADCSVFFRMRVLAEPKSGSNLYNGIWVVALGKVVNGVSKTLAWVGVDGPQGGKKVQHIFTTQ
jgi:hypothetical protein